MSLLEGKSWVAQELYNQYLELKTEIMFLTSSRAYYARHGVHYAVEKYDERLKPEVDKLKQVLNELKVTHGVAMEDLILLSLGVDV